MKSFEPIFNKLSELFIETLPEYIRKINEFYNDGLLIKYFENKDLMSNCNKLPCFRFSTEEAEYTQKDRIIENTVYTVSFTVLLPPFTEKQLIEFWRYVESIKTMLEENETDIWCSIEMSNIVENKIFLRIVV